MFEVSLTLHTTSNRFELHKTKTTSRDMWCTRGQPSNTGYRNESAPRLSTKQARQSVRYAEEVCGEGIIIVISIGRQPLEEELLALKKANCRNVSYRIKFNVCSCSRVLLKEENQDKY
ncbi:hypothetical protein KIN20_000966 [Parelaphostrongylus tenuis]|uniref:Uncharacterized protein n=1 Tax=Parelaphostrongylus tenuis TaxID=148309 RepID=A0AAD5ME34_PARTN|nr:hypothetical protein KIN20_000966 [Parelaphostrongylus tenuis]